MILLSVRDLSRQFDVEPVFRGVEFDIRAGEKVGLVGPNGSGKTTLFNILAGHDEPDEGVVERHSSCEITLLEQQTDFSSRRTLLAEARSGLAHLYDLQTEAGKLAEQMAGESETERLQRHQRRYDQIQHELDRLDAYQIEHRVEEVLHGLGFAEDEYDRPLVQFSGGQQNRAILARLLLRSPDLMLLDEPTNHLDIAATEWLEGYLARSKQAMILVSHDRYFLDRVTNRILDIQGSGVTSYPGNFSAYWRQREERNKVLQRTHEKQQEFVARTEDFIRRNKYGQKHAQASDREKKLERLEQIDVPLNVPTMSMNFGAASRSGDWVIDAVEVCKGFGEPLISDFTLQIERGDRVGILGPNGSGKTTLLRTLIGELKPDRGTVRTGTGVLIGYYDQQLSSVPSNLDAVDAVRPPDDPAFTPAMARSLLARFGIRGDLALQKVGQMSGGEKSKVALAKVAARNVNLLILDEPTNHLDLWAKDSLEEALKAFEGTLLFVSHDRYFIDRVAEHVIVLELERWQFYEGNYSSYVGFRKNQSAEAPTTQPPRSKPVEQRLADSMAPASASEKKGRPKRRFPYRKVSELEAEIAELEELAEQLQAALSDPEVHRDGDRARETLQTFEETRERLDELYEHWEEATELN